MPPPKSQGPRIEKNQSRLKFSISLENFNLDWTFQSRPSEFPTKIGVWWVARLKFTISLEIFKILIIFSLWALRDVLKSMVDRNSVPMSMLLGQGLQGFYDKLGSRRSTVSRVLFRKRELTEFWKKKLGEFAVAHKYVTFSPQTRYRKEFLKWASP